MTINETAKYICLLEETVGNGLNAIEFHLKRSADALEAQTPPKKLYGLNVTNPTPTPDQESPTEED